jgi:predicted nuclease with RNAse H fold
VTFALGIDVGVRKGLDLVLLEGLRVAGSARGVTLDGLRAWVGRWRPDVVAIDSPPRFGQGRPRATEVAVRRLGIRLYATPWDPRRAESRFYDWMRVGQQVFRVVAEAGYPLFDGREPRGTAMEAFPHACAVVLHGRLRPPEVSKEAWRRQALGTAGVDDGGLRGIDQVDAALAALAGQRALMGRFFAPGDPGEGVIVLPCRESELPSRYLGGPGGP